MSKIHDVSSTVLVRVLYIEGSRVVSYTILNSPCSNMLLGANFMNLT